MFTPTNSQKEPEEEEKHDDSEEHTYDPQPQGEDLVEKIVRQRAEAAGISMPPLDRPGTVKAESEKTQQGGASVYTYLARLLVQIGDPLLYHLQQRFR